MTPRLTRAAAACVLLVAALALLRPAGTPGGAARDFQAYLGAGAAQAARADPYSVEIARFEPELAHTPGAMLPFVGPPPSAVWWMLLARMPKPEAVAIWFALLACAMLALAYGGALIAGLRSCVDLVCALLFTLAFAPIDGAFSLGQAAVISAAAATLTAIARTPVGVGAWAFVALIFQPNVAITAIASLRRRGAAIAFGLAALVALAMSSQGLFAYLRVVRDQNAAEFGSLLQLTPASIGLPLVLSALLAVVAVAAVLFTAARKKPATSFVAGCCALPFVVTFFHAQDLSIEVVPAMWVLRNVSSRAFGVALLAVTAVGTNWLDAAASRGGLIQTAALAAALIAVALALRERVDLRAPQWTAAAFALVAAGCWIATRATLPVWPEAMHPFTPSPAMTAAFQWHLELVRTGLFNYDAAVAALRVIPLAGCAAMLALVVRTSDVDVHN